MFHVHVIGTLPSLHSVIVSSYMIRELGMMPFSVEATVLRGKLVKKVSTIKTT